MISMYPIPQAIAALYNIAGFPVLTDCFHRHRGWRHHASLVLTFSDDQQVPVHMI